MRTLPVVIMFSAALCACALGQDDISVPEGMELIKVGSNNVLVPKGTRVTRKDALLILEPLDEYASRLLASLEEEVNGLRQRVARLEEQTAALEERLLAAEKAKEDQ